MNRRTVSCLPAVLASLAGLALGACAPGAAKPTTDLPFAAPEGASDLVRDFVEICSSALADPARVGGVLAERGWEVSSLSDDANMMMGIIGADHPTLNLMLQVIPFDYPHVQGTGCSISGYDFDDIESIDLSGLDNIPGFLGDMRQFGRASSAMKLGRWSAIAPDGEPITMTANLMLESNFLNLNMNHARRVTPDADNKQ